MTQLEFMARLVSIAESLAHDRRSQITDDVIRKLSSDIASARRSIVETEDLIGYEATCLIECIAELAYARSDRDANRESRAIMYINTLLNFIRSDMQRAERRVTQ